MVPSPARRRESTFCLPLSPSSWGCPSLWRRPRWAFASTRGGRASAGTRQRNWTFSHPNPRGIGSYRLKPNLAVATAVGPYQVRIQTNRHGMRWREVSKEKTDARQRVGFLGDSFTFGCWAEDVEHSLVGVFEKSVSLERWEVLNFGVGGYGFADIELQLREEALQFDLSYAILVSFNGNDFRDTYLGIGKDRIIHGTAVLDDDVLEEKVPALFLRKDRHDVTAELRNLDTPKKPTELRPFPSARAVSRYGAPCHRFPGEPTLHCLLVLVASSLSPRCRRGQGRLSRDAGTDGEDLR